MLITRLPPFFAASFRSVRRIHRRTHTSEIQWHITVSSWGSVPRP